MASAAPSPRREKSRPPSPVTHVIVRAARRVAGRLARLFKSLSDDYADWVPDDGQISYTGGNVGIGATTAPHPLTIGGSDPNTVWINRTASGTDDGLFWSY